MAYNKIVNFKKPFPQRHILIVDDEPNNVRLLEKILSNAGHKVHSVENGVLALPEAQRLLPDLILLDIMMPGIDGYDVCQLLKSNERTRPIPIIFISAVNETANKIKALRNVIQVTTYTYNAAGQLVQTTVDGQPSATSYSYDANGNRLAITDTLGTLYASYDAQDRLQSYGSWVYTYTAQGDLSQKTNTTSQQSVHYSYNVFGSLTGVTLPDSAQIDYLIDGRQRRVGKKVNGSLTRGWLYRDQLNPVAELDAAGQLLSRFVYAQYSHTPVYMLKNGQTYRLLSDHRGSVRLVVNAVTGIVVQELAYDAFGQVLTDTNPGFQPFGFAGGLYDPDTGLVRFGRRDYDPTVGRWTWRAISTYIITSAFTKAWTTKHPPKFTTSRCQIQ